jgi:hypothetical protein
LSRKKPGSRKNTFFRADVKKLRGGKNQQLQKRGLSGQALVRALQDHGFWYAENLVRRLANDVGE